MMKLRPNGSRKVAKEAHEAQGRRSKAKSADQKEAPKRSVQKTTEPLSQRPPQAARGGGRTAVLPGMHGLASPTATGCFGFFCALSFSCAIFGLSVALSLKEHVSRRIRGIIHHTILIF